MITKSSAPATFFFIFPFYNSSNLALRCILMQVLISFNYFVSFICLSTCWTEIGREIVSQAALPLPLIVLFVYSIYNTIVVKLCV